MTGEPHALPTRDGVSVVRWLLIYALFLAATAGPLAWLLAEQSWQWTWSPRQIGLQLREMDAAVKLLALLVYISLCSTFLPLPANAIISAVAMRQFAVTGEFWSTTLLVAVAGAAGSTMANLNDYHLFTWMLRSRRVAGVRNTKLYRVSAKWFARSPFAILTVFNIIPIPVDVVRMLATTCRYPRGPFAAANFLGRFVRYAVIAAVTFLLGERGWVAVVALLVVAAIFGVGRYGLRLLWRRRANDSPAGVSARSGP